MINPTIHPVLQIEQAGSMWSFHFDIIHFRENIKYCVTAFEDNIKTCLFFMEKINQKWKIINAPQIDNRFLLMETALNAFLIEHAFILQN